MDTKLQGPRSEILTDKLALLCNFLQAIGIIVHPDWPEWKRVNSKAIVFSQNDFDRWAARVARKLHDRKEFNRWVERQNS